MPSISLGSSGSSGSGGGGGSTPVGARPRAASLQTEPDSPLAARPSCAAQSRGGGRSSGQRSSHPERAAVRCGCHRGRRS
jgi:hypothetical protein